MTRQELEILRELQERAKRGTLAGVYSDLPIELYHRPDCPGISSTTIKKVLRSIEHMMPTLKDRRPFRFGNAFHTFKLEPGKFRERYHIQVDKKDKGPPGSGLTLIPKDEFDCIKAMDRKLSSHPDARTLLDGAKVEHTFFSQDQETGLWKKCRADAWKYDGEFDEVSDLKSTKDASRRSFMMDAAKYGYHISGAYYLEIMGEVLGRYLNRFNLIACEKTEPFGAQVFRISSNSLFAGEKLVRRALRLIAETSNPNTWRGYPLGIHELEIPDFFNAGGLYNE